MERIPYASIIRGLMNTQTCIKLDINFAIEMLGGCQSYLGLDH